MTQIWAHTLVRNEERYLWYSVMSVIDFVDKILIWDTGSDDNSVTIIKEIIKFYPDKVMFKEYGRVNAEEFTSARQKMLDETKSDWFMILDGDEVWWTDSIKTLTETIRKEGEHLDSIVSPYYNIVGDIFHFQEQKAGKYTIDGKSGHLNIRAVNTNIPGLHFERPHGQQGIYDNKGKVVQYRNAAARKYVESFYLHFTNVERSKSRSLDIKVPKRAIKYKHDLGISFPRDFYYPEVFFEKKPDIVKSPWVQRSMHYLFVSSIEHPLKIVKRHINFLNKSGY